MLKEHLHNKKIKLHNIFTYIRENNKFNKQKYINFHNPGKMKENGMGEKKENQLLNAKISFVVIEMLMTFIKKYFLYIFPFLFLALNSRINYTQFGT